MAIAKRLRDHNPASRTAALFAITGSYPEDGGTTTASYDLTIDRVPELVFPIGRRRLRRRVELE